MRVQLLNPPVRHYQGVHYRMNPPLALPILSSVLRQAGHECEVTDLEALGVSPDRLREAWAGQRDRWPDVVGITALTSSARGARDTVDALRGAGYGGRIAVGGVHATLYSDEVAAWPGVDLVVNGECEGNVCELLESGTGVQAGIAPPIDAVPAPDWPHHRPLPNEYWGNAPHLALPEAITMWTRGCPYACEFCGNVLYSPSAKRFRPVPAILAELEGLKVYGTRSLFVYDDELVGVRQPDGWLHELSQAIEPLGYEWKTQGRCSRKHISPSVCTDLVRAGCRIVMWGCESFSGPILRRLGKGTAPEDNWHTLRTARASGLRNFVFSMIGNSHETEEDLATTCGALREAYKEGLIQYRQTTVVTALPGTRLWDEQHRDGWFHEPPEAGPQMAQVYHDTPWLKGERIAYWLQKFTEACPVGIEGVLQ